MSAEIETELKDTVNYGYGTSGGAGWSKLLTSYNGESIVYNTAGNPTTYRGANLDWYGRELTSYTKGDNTLSFTYDADGLRATKKVNGVISQYKYDDEHVTYERRGTTDIYYWYDGNGHLFAIRCYFADGTNVLYYATTNSRGDVLGLYTGGGDQQVWYEYDAWGNTTITDTSTSGIGSINPIRYRGYYYDNETNLYYLQSRYYDPETGRFLNADALEFLGEGGEITGYNLYKDPSGYGPVGTIIGGILGFGLGALLVPRVADLLKLKGWGRKVFIWAGVAALTGLGAYVGNYVGKAIFAVYKAGGAFAAQINKAIAKGISKLVGGTLKSASGNGWVINIKKIVVRVMTSSNYRNNYFKISVAGKAAYDIFGKVSSDPAKIHIPITFTNIIKLVKLIFKLK